MSTSRYRTLAPFVAGAVLALVAGAVFQDWRVEAIDPDEATYVPISPCRLIDTRPAPDRIGPHAAFGIDDTKVISTSNTDAKCSIAPHATGLSTNITALNATAPTYLTVWPDGRRPIGSSLNPFPGQPPAPNAVSVALSPGSTFNMYNRAGTVDVIVDVVGYYTNNGMLELQQRLNTQLGRLDADVTIGHGTNDLLPNSFSTPTVKYSVDSTEVGGSGFVQTGLSGPTHMLGQAYGLKSVKYCIGAVQAGSQVAEFRVEAYRPGDLQGTTFASDTTPRNTKGCYSLTVGAKGFDSYNVAWDVTAPGGSLRIYSLESVWARATTLP